MVFMALALTFLSSVLLVVLTLKNWFIKYIRQSRAYANVPCPPNRLPLLGNLLNLPIGAYRKTSEDLLLDRKKLSPALF